MGGFTECFADLQDPRTGNATRHPLLEVLMIALCAMLCGAEGCVDMEEFGKAKERFLKRFLTLPHGIPSHDTFSRIFRFLDPEQFGTCFQAFVRRFAKAHQGVIAVEGKTTRQGRYYLLSTGLSAERFNSVVRDHWGIENRLHWVLEVVMNEDQARNRKDNGPENLAVPRHMALNIIKADSSKGSNRGKFKRAGWNDSFLANLLAQV